MKAAIDIDGTLAAWPGVVAPLTRALVAAGWDVVLLTGSCAPDPGAVDRHALLAARHAQVAPLGAAFREIVVCVGRDPAEVATQKAGYLRANAVDLFVDDTPAYWHEARRLAPHTLTLGVQP